MRRGKTDIQADFSIGGGQQIDAISTDNTLASNSNNEIPTVKAVKEYVDSVSQGLDWQDSILDQIDFTTVEPSSPSLGNRYINTVTGTSSQTSQSVTQNYIYEWGGSGVGWIETQPNEGFATWDEDENVLYVFNGSSWVKFGSTITHENLLGLQGGTTSQYYHLTSAEHSELTNWLDNVTLGSGGELTLPSGATINEFSTDGTLGGNSNTAVPTEQAVKTYVDANSGGNGLSNIIFSWVGHDSNGGAVDIGNGIFWGDSQQPQTANQQKNLFMMMKRSNTTSYFNMLNTFRWTKIDSVNTITVHFRAWMDTSGSGSRQIQVNIGGQTGASSAFANTSPSNQTSFTINVSSLTNGNTYDIDIQGRLTGLGFTGWLYMSAITLIGS